MAWVARHRSTNLALQTFNGSLRDECLSLHWLATIAEAKTLIEAWRLDYNESRSHMALGNRTLQECRLQASSSHKAMSSTAGES